MTDASPLPRTDRSEAASRPSPLLTLERVAFLGMLLTLAVYMPGFMSADSLDQLRQARISVFSDWHPPVMAWVWKGMDGIVAGPFGMLLLQAAAWWFGLALFIGHLFRHRLAPLLLLVVGFWPPFFAMVGTIWKDVQMATAMTLACGLLLLGKKQGGWPLYAALLALAYAAAMRHNALPAVIPLAAFAAWLASARLVGWIQRLLIILLVTGGLIVLPTWVNDQATDVKGYAIQTLFAYDLVGISTQVGQNLLPPAIQPHPLTPSELQSMYTPWSLAPIYWNVDPRLNLTISSQPEAVAELQQAWRSAVWTHKAAYLKHRYQVFLKQLGWTPEVYYPYHRGIDPNTLGVSHTPSKLTSKVLSQLDTLKDGLMFRTWVYGLVLFGVLGVCLRGILQREPRALLAALLATSGLLYLAPYYLISVAADLRYNLWAMISCMLALLVLGAGHPAWRASEPLERFHRESTTK